MLLLNIICVRRVKKKETVPNNIEKQEDRPRDPADPPSFGHIIVVDVVGFSRRIRTWSANTQPSPPHPPRSSRNDDKRVF